MCGIAGIVAFNENGKNHFSAIDTALTSLSKRGPDSFGKLIHKNVCLGHTRLAILDLSELGSQPMTDFSGRYSICFNGEFYNYKEKRKFLIDKGFSFRSDSDTEVLLNLYAYYGPSFLELINGFFAFAIYDHECGDVFIARDRMGIKPLYYYQDENKLVFGSELKALIKLGIEKEIDHFSLHTYFETGYIPAPYSIYQNVKKLNPGNSISIKNGQVQVHTYYAIPLSLKGDYSKDDYDKAKSKVRNLVQDAVELRMISDVPLGSFLSGGIDSSIISTVASRFTQKLHTFSIGYKDNPFFDETKYALSVARKIQSEHTVFSLSENDLFENLYRVLDYTDEPFADSSAIAVNILSMQTRKNVTVALSGDGGDELFAGYHKHFAEYQIRAGGLKSSIVKLLGPLWNAMPQSRSSGWANRFRQFARYSNAANLTPAERYWRLASVIDHSSVKRLFNEELNQDEWNEKRKFYLSHFTADGDINEVLYADMKLVLPNDMLYKVDMMSMENSLEVRVPLLDYRLVNYVFSLPPHYKIDSKRKKKLLIDAFSKDLPEELLNRPKKGFEVPMLQWLKAGLQPLLSQYTSKELIESQGLFNYDELVRMKNKLFTSNPGDVHFQLWSMIVFQHWWKNYHEA